MFWPWAFPSFFFFFFSYLVRLSLSLHWVFLVLFFGFSEVSPSVSASGGALLLSFCRSFMLPLRLPCFQFLASFTFLPSMIGVDLPLCYSCMPIPALQVPLSRPLAICFRSCSFFADPPSPVQSRPFLLYFPSGYSVFLCTVFLLGPAVALHFYIHIHDFNVTIPCFLFIDLVLFLFWGMVRFPSLSAGSEGVGPGCPHSSSRHFIKGVTWFAVMPLCSPGRAHSPLWYQGHG